MLELELSTQFKRDLKKISKQGKNRCLLNEVIEYLQKEITLHPKHKDHNLSGNGTVTGSATLHQIGF